MSDDPQPCARCNGSGFVDEVECIADEMHIKPVVCPSCGGSGRA